MIKQERLAGLPADTAAALETFNRGWKLRGEALEAAEHTGAPDRALFQAANDVFAEVPECLEAPRGHLWVAKASIGHVEVADEVRTNWFLKIQRAGRSIDPAEEMANHVNAIVPGHNDEVGAGLFVGRLLERGPILSASVEATRPQFYIHREPGEIADMSSSKDYRFQLLGADALNLATVRHIRIIAEAASR